MCAREVVLAVDQEDWSSNSPKVHQLDTSLTPFSNERGSLEKWLILRLEGAVYKISLEHVTVAKSKKVL